MLDKLKRIICVVLMFVVVIAIFYMIDNKNKDDGKQNISDLVIFGENIATKYAPFVENGGMYISVDTISQTLDEEIYYDKIATKVIITTYDDVIKLKIDENKISKNLEYTNISTPAKLVNGQPYIDINLLKGIYDIKLEYNEQEKILSIDKTDTSDINIKYNRVNVYSDISTKSKVLTTISKLNKVTVYNETFKHKRWYKVKTDTGIVGYISKNNVDVIVDNNENENNNTNENNTNNTAEKITMFWQYGSNLTTLGSSKIDGVNVVSPTWFELKNSSGDITSSFNQNYYNMAKSYGYKLWPIITNGIDSTSYLPSDTTEFLQSEYSREKFIRNIISVCKANKIDGINIDFEQMNDDDRDLFTQLIREMAPLLRKEKITLSVDLYFVKYIDRMGIGKVADYVILMGYDQRGGWSSEAGSISEIYSFVEKNVSSLINDSQISPNKIILGVPFYSRMWTQKAGDTKPTSKIYSMQDCLDFVKDNNLTTKYDETSGQNYAEYTKGQVTYKLWLEDLDSLKKRIDIINKYNLAGISGWQKGLATSDVWQVIRENMK